MANKMITLTQMLEPANSIQFTPSRDGKEPHVIVVIFSDWKKATVYYDEIKAVWKDGEMSFEFKKVGNKLWVEFIKKSEYSSYGHILVDYKPNELLKFVNEVDLGDAYALAFGSMDKDQLILSMGTRTDNRVLLFSGYKMI
jgi:hypothetical protein